MKPARGLPGMADHPPRVLVVDDEPSNLQLLEVMLTPEGYKVYTAGNGEEALAMVVLQKPDVILLDVMMPVMNGYELARRLKADPATATVPIIMVTALDNRDARMRGLTAGAEDFLSKPVDRAELCVRVRNLLRLKAYGDYCETYSATLEREVLARTAELVERTTALEAQAGVLTEQAALLDLTQDAIVVRDMAGVVLFWSRGAETLYGWTASEALGRKTADLLRVEPSPVNEGGKRILLNAGRWEGEEVHHQRDGKAVTVASRWALQYDEEGVPMRILTINNDISSRKLADAERVLLTERLSLATAVAQVGVWEWDLATGSLIWDATMFGIYGFAPVVPLPYTQWAASVWPEDLPATEAALQLAVATRGQSVIEFRIVLADGAIRTISGEQRVISDDKGNAVRVIGVNMDVTARKEAERTLEQSRNDQMRFKDEFLSHVSHELRSPLTAIKQFSSILHGGLAGELNPEQRQYQEIVLKNIRQLESMIDDLLEVTRLETGKVTVEQERVPLADAVADALDTLQGTATAKGVRLTYELAPGLPWASADPTRVRQILIVLLDNAVKFTPPKGLVCVSVGLVDEDPGFLLVEVRDTGSGIDPAMAERLFERLYQAPEAGEGSRKGLGLGLFICKELVTRQGGRIWARPAPERGTVLAFTLPVFSLASVVAPLIKDDRWPSETVALVRVEFSPRSGEQRPSEEWSEQARSVLRRCLLPDLDVLLPGAGQGSTFFVAAFASEKGVAVLNNRLRSQCQRHVPLAPGQGIAVSHTMIHTPPFRPGDSPAAVVAAMAERLEESIRSSAAEEVLA